MNTANHARFEGVFTRTMGVDQCRAEYAMGQLTQWDSLKHVELLTELDEVFGIQIEPTDLWQMTSVSGILDVLSKYVD
jgi:hypothetical protein